MVFFECAKSTFPNNEPDRSALKFRFWGWSECFQIFDLVPDSSKNLPPSRPYQLRRPKADFWWALGALEALPGGALGTPEAILGPPRAPKASQGHARLARFDILG